MVEVEHQESKRIIMLLAEQLICHRLSQLGKVMFSWDGLLQVLLSLLLMLQAKLGINQIKGIILYMLYGVEH